MVVGLCKGVHVTFVGGMGIHFMGCLCSLGC